MRMSRLTFVITCESRACNYLKAVVNRVIQCNLVELYVTRIYREITLRRETSNRKIGISSQGWSLVRGTHVLNSKRLCLTCWRYVLLQEKRNLERDGGEGLHMLRLSEVTVDLCSTSSYVSDWRKLDPPLPTLARNYAENDSSIVNGEVNSVKKTQL